MPDDLTDSGPQDGKLIALNQKHEVRRWCAKFGVSRERLREAVEKVGPSASRVASYLGAGDLDLDEDE